MNEKKRRLGRRVRCCRICPRRTIERPELAKSSSIARGRRSSWRSKPQRKAKLVARSIRCRSTRAKSRSGSSRWARRGSLSFRRTRASRQLQLQQCRSIRELVF